MLVIKKRQQGESMKKDEEAKEVFKELAEKRLNHWISDLQHDRLNTEKFLYSLWEKGYKRGLKSDRTHKIMPLICLRCRKPIPLTLETFWEVSYTHYSYCEECLRKGLKLLKEQDKRGEE